MSTEPLPARAVVRLTKKKLAALKVKAAQRETTIQKILGDAVEQFLKV